MAKEVKKEKMLEWMWLVLLISAILGSVIIVKCHDDQAGIAVAGMVIVIVSAIALMVVGMCLLSGIDVKVGLGEGNTYFVKSATYDGDYVRLNLQEIDVAVNNIIGPEFLHKRNAELVDLKAGDIVIYQGGEMKYWISPF